MRVVGVAVDASKPKRPAARIVVAGDASGSPAIEGVLDLSGDDVELPTQLHYAAEALRSHLKSVGADRVVVRRADYAPRARQTDGPKNRLLMEGALTSAATSVVSDTRLGTGKETGEWFGSNKNAVDAAAAALLKSGERHGRFLEATSAALAGLALAP
jgi:NADPH-dependent ferric siderophore reductase